MFWKSPGWRPADVAARFPEPEFSLEAAAALDDPPVGLARAIAATLHFAGWVGMTLAFLWRADDMAFRTGLELLALTVAGFWAVGAALDARLRLRWAWPAQVLLLALAGAILFAAG